MAFFDPQAINVIIIIHAIFGSMALISGPGAMIAMKGGSAHRAFGKLFFYTMMITAVLALIISNLPGHHNFFLFLMGIFSIYMVSTGYRYLYLESIHKGQKPTVIDWILTLGMALFGLLLFTGGIAQCLGLWLMIGDRSFGIVLIVFGGLSLLMVRQDLKAYRGKVQYRNHWLFMHISRMIGANIAAFTAFLVVNNKIVPGIFAWLLPTAIGIPIIFYWINKQKKVRGMKIVPKAS